MSRPAFPFQMLLVQAEDKRDECRRHFLQCREVLRQHQTQRRHQADVLEALYGELLAQRTAHPRGAWEQNHAQYLQRQHGRLNDLQKAETGHHRTVEMARRELLAAAVRCKVWESLKERFNREWETRQRRREEAELEDWTRARFSARLVRTAV